MLRSRVFDQINNGDLREVQVLARAMALHIEKFGPYGLKEFEAPLSEAEIQFRPKNKVDELVGELKAHIPIIQQWYVPEHVTTMALLTPRTTKQMAQIIIDCYGEVTHQYQRKNIEKMIRLILSIAGMVNNPVPITIDEHFTSERRWKLHKGVRADDRMLFQEFNTRMGN